MIPVERIEQRIYMLRGEKIMLSADLARLYQVAPRVLVQGVKRNAVRFPDDFMFQLTHEEYGNFEITNLTSDSKQLSDTSVDAARRSVAGEM